MTNPIHHPVTLRFVLAAASAAVLCGCGSVENATNPDASTTVADASASDDARIEDATSVDAMQCSQTTCADGVLTVCDASGSVDRVETCRLGCAANDRCNWLQPSNGVGAQLAAAAGQGAITLPTGAVINSDSGAVQAGNQVIAVATATVPQTGGRSIRVFVARSWTVRSVRVTGSLPVAFVSIGDVIIEGVIDVSADGAVSAPGTLDCGAGGTGGAPTTGAWSRSSGGGFVWATPGAGGGGFGTAGGKGGDYPTSGDPLIGAPGGVANGTASLIPLRGGCRGGANSRFTSSAGFGGGAVQIVSAAGEIVVRGAGSALAGVHAGGSGGNGCATAGVSDPNTNGSTACVNSGGGSGGGILIEAPSVRFEVSSALLAAGGGGGGYGDCGDARHGQDAPASAATPAGGSCPPRPAGGDGAAAAPAQAGVNGSSPAAGSGGGGHGRIRINTASGTYSGEANVVIRGALTTGTVQMSE